MERTLALLAQGYSIVDCMRQLGREQGTFHRWRKEDPSFAARAEAILQRNHPKRKSRAKNVVELPKSDLDTSTFGGFRKRFFGFDTYPHQQQIVDAYQSAAPGTTTMVLMPPEWMKTTTTTDFICQTIANDPNRRICYITESLGLAKKVAGRIRRRMTDRSIAADFIDTFGPFKAPDRSTEKVWNQQEFMVLRSNHDEGDYTFECRGSTSNIYGSRYDDVFLDDIQSRRSASPTHSQTLLELFRADWRTRPSKSGRIFILGTRVAPQDFYELMLKEGLVQNLVMIRALDDGGKSNFPAVYNEDGTRAHTDTGDPLGWTEEELAKRRDEVGEDTWWRVYMQTGKASGVGPFTDVTIARCKDPQRGPGRMGKHATPFGRIGGVDSALGGHAGFAVCSYDAERLYVEEVRSVPNLQRTEDIFSIVEEMTIEHLPDEWVWDTRGFQKGFARDDRNAELRDKYGFAVIEHETGSERLDDKIGIPSLASAVRRAELSFPADEDGEAMMAVLYDEMTSWRLDIPKKMLKQDTIDGLWYCYLRWQQLRETLNSSIESFNRTGSASFTPYRTSLGTWL